MDQDVRRFTELQMRREAQDLDRPMFIARLQCHTGVKGLDVRTLRGWEERTHAPSLAFHEALCDYLRVDSVAELGLGKTLQAAHHWAWMSSAERKEEVHRRKLLRVMAVTGLLLPASELVAVAQMLDGTPSVDAADLDAATQVAIHLARSYIATPNPGVITAANAHAYTLGGLLKRASMSPDTRTRLQVLASDASALAGYGHLNAGRAAEADAWFADAIRFAREAGDRQWEALALVSSAWTALEPSAPDFVAARVAFEAAAELQRYLQPAAHAYVFSALVDIRAYLGDDLGSGRLLEQVHATAARTSPDEPGWGWWSVHGQLAGWDGVRAEVLTGWRSLLLERPAEAVAVYDSTLDRVPWPVRRAKMFKDLTQACVALGDPDRACASAHVALDEVQAHGIGLYGDQIRKARMTFPARWSALAPVVELDERLRQVA